MAPLTPRGREIARRNIAHAQNGTIDQTEGIFRIPVDKYLDEGQFQLEVDNIFKRVPLLLAIGGELKNPGDYKAFDAMDVPVLIIRGEDGDARAFINMCSHRGSQVVQNGSGTGRRFSCPYHNWTYDREGQLVGLTDRENFGELDTSCMGLTALPVAERAGLIFVILTPGVEMDIDDWLQGYDDELSYMDFSNWTVVTTNDVPGPNWKIAYDGYTDFYHLPFLHKDSFGADGNRLASYDAWGPHQRVSAPYPELLEFADVPEQEWTAEELGGGIFTMFPNISFACGPDGGMISQLWPGKTAGESHTIQYHCINGEATEEKVEASKQSAAFLEQVVRDEDYFTGFQIQKALKTGAKEELFFGRNEGGGRHFHEWVDKLAHGR